MIINKLIINHLKPFFTNCNILHIIKTSSCFCYFFTFFKFYIIKQKKHLVVQYLHYYLIIFNNRSAFFDNIFFKHITLLNYFPFFSTYSACTNRIISLIFLILKISPLPQPSSPDWLITRAHYCPPITNFPCLNIKAIGYIQS